MPENITITFAGSGPGQEVGVRYEPATPEAEAIDALVSVERGLHALTVHALRLRQQLGLPAHPALNTIAAAHTFREIRSNANPWRGES